MVSILPMLLETILLTPMKEQPPPLNRDYTRDPNAKACLSAVYISRVKEQSMVTAIVFRVWGRS